MVVPDSLTLVATAEYVLTAKLIDGHGAALSAPVTWSTANPAVAAVDSSGTVLGIDTGRTTITATSQGKSGYASVVVIPRTDVEYVTVNPPYRDLTVGTSLVLTATAFSATGDSLRGRAFTWSSGDPTVATVDAATGKVTGVAPGVAIIGAAVGGIIGYIPIGVITVAPGVNETDLGDLGGGAALAYGINDSGTVVGESATASGEGHAFRWTAAGGMTDLGTLGGNYSSARAVNASGVIVGLSTTATGVQHAFRWTSAGGMQDLGDPASDTVAAAYAISAGGWIAGATGMGATVWSPDGTRTDISIYVSQYTSAAYGIDDNGHVVGDVDDSYCDYYCYGGVRAYEWTIGTGAADLGLAYGSSAKAINSRGDIAGVLGSGRSAFLLMGGTSAQELATPPNGGSSASAINVADQVAGTAATASGVYHPTYWPSPSTMLFLSLSQGWVGGINTAGQMVGAAYDYGSPPRAKLWTVSTPAAARRVPVTARSPRRASVHP